MQAARFMATAAPAGLKGEVLRGYLFPYGSFKDRVAIYRFVKDIPMKLSHVSYPVLKDIESRLPSLKDKRIALVWGCRDFCFTTHFLERWKEFFPGAETFALKNAGHYVLEDEAKQVARIVGDFFRQD